MNTTDFQASARPPAPKTGMAGMATSAAAARLPEPSGLTQDEIRQIILDLIG